MAETARQSYGAQDTGNPVLDSVVNIMAGWGRADLIREVHAVLLELAEKEPGGLARRSKDGVLVLQPPASSSGEPSRGVNA
jgi:hypothetical protein